MLYTLYTSMLSPQMHSDIDGWIEFFIVSYVIRPTPIPNSAPSSRPRLLPSTSPPPTLPKYTRSLRSRDAQPVDRETSHIGSAITS